MKRKVSDAQFKNQVIFTIKGMQANIRKIQKMFPQLLYTQDLDFLISQIKSYQSKITRKPK